MYKSNQYNIPDSMVKIKNKHGDFKKGIVHSESQYNNKPLSIIQHCFPWREGTGIIDQDVISEPGPSTTKYVCLAKESSHSSTKLPMAIKYAY